MDKKDKTVSFSTTGKRKGYLLQKSEMECMSVSEYMDMLLAKDMAESEGELMLLAQALGVQIKDI